MGELAKKAKRYDVVKGKLGTRFERVYGCKRLDRMVAKAAMKAEGIVRPCKAPRSAEHGRGKSYFAIHWRDYAYGSKR